MPFQPATNILEVRSLFTLPQREQMVNVFHVRNPAPGTTDPADWLDVYAVFEGAWSTELSGVTSPDVTYAETQITDLTTADAMAIRHAFGGVGTGSASNMLPTQTSAVVTWYTAKRGKSWHGRSFIGGFQEDHNDDSSPDATVIAALNDWADALVSGLAANAPASPLVVLSRQFGGHMKQDPPIEPTIRAVALGEDVTGHRVEDAWRTQRRRALK